MTCHQQSQQNWWCLALRLAATTPSLHQAPSCPLVSAFALCFSLWFCSAFCLGVSFSSFSTLQSLSQALDSSNIIYPRAVMSFPEWLTSPFLCSLNTSELVTAELKRPGCEYHKRVCFPHLTGTSGGDHGNAPDIEQVANGAAGFLIGPSPQPAGLSYCFIFGQQGQVYSHDLGKRREPSTQAGTFYFSSWRGQRSLRTPI